MGLRFKLSRSVRQGCPLAPLLFLIFVEALHSFLHSQPVNVRGINSLEFLEPIMDSEFADDTNMYINGLVTNLWAVYKGLPEFCEALGDLVN